VRVRVWGARGSVPAPGPATARYGGNTSCVQVTLDDGTHVILDAGTGIRTLGLAMPQVLDGPLHILLTHLHLDHIQGLMFFAPAFRPDAEIVIWGPYSEECSLQDRIGRYISAPLTPVEVRELPCKVSFREADPAQWMIGGAMVEAASVTHRGPTLGYRITDGSGCVCFIPDHEPGLGTPLAHIEDEWVSGLGLARGADLLIHDCQYTDDEYPRHLGWGHTSLTDAIEFGARAGAGRLALFHHDPLHDDAFLDAMGEEAQRLWVARGREPDTVCLAREGDALELGHRAQPAERRAIA
jgi:phosphoribosyl 1,2-cyclic phosphodiesterase